MPDSWFKRHLTQVYTRSIMTHTADRISPQDRRRSLIAQLTNTDRRIG